MKNLKNRLAHVPSTLIGFMLLLIVAYVLLTQPDSLSNLIKLFAELATLVTAFVALLYRSKNGTDNTNPEQADEQ